MEIKEIREGELTHKQLYNIAIRLDKKSDIRQLSFQLDVEHKIDAIFANRFEDITEAVYEMLKEWRKGQRDKREAYTNLWAALTHPDVNLRSVAHEALGSDHDWIIDLDGVCMKRRQQEKKHRENYEKINYLSGKTSESEMCESHLDEGIQCKRPRLEEQDDIIPLGPWRWRGDPFVNRVLQDDHLERMAARMDKNDMYRLGTVLVINNLDFDRIFAKHCLSCKDAIQAILTGWLRTQENRHVAYINMGEALIHPDVGLNLIATEVLHYPQTNCLVISRKHLKYGRKLKNIHIKKLSAKLNKSEMYRLGRKLGISRKKINRKIAKFSSVPKAAQQLLSRWLKRQNSREEAYCAMTEALVHPDVGLNLIAREVLDYPPTKAASKSSRKRKN